MKENVWIKTKTFISNVNNLNIPLKTDTENRLGNGMSSKITEKVKVWEISRQGRFWRREFIRRPRAMY